jgi:hypothetical protein
MATFFDLFKTNKDQKIQHEVKSHPGPGLSPAPQEYKFFDLNCSSDAALKIDSNAHHSTHFRPRIALCLFGLAGTLQTNKMTRMVKSEVRTARIAHETIWSHFVEANYQAGVETVDVFVHSWHEQNDGQKIDALWGPRLVSSQHERQQKFADMKCSNHVDKHGKKKSLSGAVASTVTSMHRALALKSKHEAMVLKARYDVVMVARHDLFLLRAFPVTHLDPCKLWVGDFCNPTHLLTPQCVGWDIQPRTEAIFHGAIIILPCLMTAM